MYQEQLITEYWKDQGMIEEALREAVAEDSRYSETLLRLKADHDYCALGKLTVIVVDNYFTKLARVNAEDKVSWEN